MRQACSRLLCGCNVAGLVDEACDLSPLFASEAKFMQAVYAGALSARPSDCVALLELACAGGVRCLCR